MIAGQKIPSTTIAQRQDSISGSPTTHLSRRVLDPLDSLFPQLGGCVGVKPEHGDDTFGDFFAWAPLSKRQSSPVPPVDADCGGYSTV